MSSIGNLNFIRMTGPQVPKLAAAVEIIDRTGVDGTASRIDALKAAEINKFTVQGVETLNIANAAADTYASYKGTHVTICDDLGRTVQSVLVVDVRVTSVQHTPVSDPAEINYLVRAAWVLKPTM